MLFRLSRDFATLEPLPFRDVSAYQQREKDLENLIATNLFETLFEGMPLLPFFQERNYQAESDIYALDRSGDVVLFELKVGTAGTGALDQLFRYTQAAGQWLYSDIDRKFRGYSGDERPGVSVAEAHQEAFDLRGEERLAPNEFNRAQHMWIVGQAANEGLISAVEFWRDKGLSIDFLPYRIYELHDELVFEFFSKPYDFHRNPALVKGVIFDTCRRFVPDGLQHMCENSRVSAWGDQKHVVHRLGKGDLVFYSHRGTGLVAAGRVAGKVRADGDGELFVDVEFLTPPLTNFEVFPNAMPFSKVKEVMGKDFYWARTIKSPYLSRDEAEKLLAAMLEPWH